MPEKAIQIDLDYLIKSKKPELYRKLPKCIVRLVGRIIHVKDINAVLAKFADLKGVAFTKAMLDDLNIKRITKGLDNLPTDREYIFASNHPLGGLDGLALVEQIDLRFKGVKVIVNDLLMNLTPLKDIFLPINKFGRQTGDYARQLSNHFDSKAAIIYFPAGVCSRFIKGRINDFEWKKNFVQKAIENHRDIVPTYVAERNSRLFYTVAWLRVKLGIKVNIEMLLLPHELFKKAKRKGEVKMIFGEPITYEQLTDGSKSINEWTVEIRNRSYELKKLLGK